MKRRKSKTRLKAYTRKLGVITIVTLLALVFLWPYLRSATLKFLVPVGRGTMGVLEDKMTGEAIFSDGAVLISSPASGNITWLVENGSSVRSGQVLGEIITGDTAEAYKESLNRAKAQLASYEESTKKHLRLLMDDIQTSYEEALDAFSAIQSSSLPVSTDLFAQENAFLEAGLDIEATRTEITNIENRRAELAKTVDLVEQAFSSSKVKILAPISGTFQLNYKPVEKELLESNLGTKDASQLSLFIRKVNQDSGVTVANGEKVNVGDVLGKLVHGQAVTFYIPMKTEEKPDVRSDSRVVVRFSDGFEVDAVIQACSDGKPPGYSVVQGSIDIMPQDRVAPTQRIELISASRTGIIVPSTALYIKDGQVGVLSLQKTFARFVPVQVLMELGDKTVIRGISETDEILLRASGFWEDRRVR